MTHLCSFRVTHTKNTIWRSARTGRAISSTPKACKAFTSVGTIRQMLAIARGQAFGAPQTRSVLVGSRVIFREQTRVNSPERRRFITSVGTVVPAQVTIINLGLKSVEDLYFRPRPDQNNERTFG